MKSLANAALVADQWMRWHLIGAPEYIEAHWGPDLADTASAVIQQVVASWSW